MSDTPDPRSVPVNCKPEIYSAIFLLKGLDRGVWI